MNVSRNTTVPNSTKPMTCLKVSIQAPGLGRKRTSDGNGPQARRYGLAMPEPDASKEQSR